MTVPNHFRKYMDLVMERAARMGVATPDEMRRATTDLLRKMSNYPNFVISSGCDTPPHTPFANIDAFFEAVGEWNSKL